MTALVYEHIRVAECGDPLVDLATYPFTCDPVYYRQGWSDTPAMHLRRTVADKLRDLQEGHLAKNNLCFRIFDAYRPRTVQAAIYKYYAADIAQKNPHLQGDALQAEIARFVTNPDDPVRIPPHATGGAVDLTLMHVHGAALDMGTSFDYFGAEAAPYYFENHSNVLVRDNRRLLHGLMLAAGFVVDPDEWWHFDFGNQKWALQSGNSTAIFGELISSP